MSPKGKSKTKWWQIIPLYTGIIVAGIGAIPKYTDWALAIWHGIDTDKLAWSQKQNEIWQRNINCHRTGRTITTKTVMKTRVAVRLCKTGDILISIRNGGNPYHQWIDYQNYNKKHKNVSWFRNSLYAAPKTSIPFIEQVFDTSVETILCQTQKERYIIRIIKVGKKCFQHIIDTFKGTAVEIEVSCNTKCNPDKKK